MTALPRRRPAPGTPFRLGLVAAVSLASPAALAGQAVSVQALVAVPNSSARVSGITMRMDGVWAGLGVGIDAGRFTLTANGTRGQVNGTPSSAIPATSLGEVGLGGLFHLAPWLAVGARYTARALSSAAGYERWDMMGAGARVARDLGTPAVSTFAALTYLPVVRLKNETAPTFGVGGEAGATVTPAGSPLALMLVYRIERFHFSDAATRAAQFETLSLAIGVRAHSQRCRWTLSGSKDAIPPR